MFERVWGKLHADERFALQLAAAFRSPAPQSTFEVLKDAIAISKITERLQQRGLIQINRSDGVTMWSAVRHLIRQTMTTEEREQTHLNAANVRLQYGDYTAAAYHCLQAGKQREAVKLWFPQRQLEIQRGQAAVAA